MELDKNFFVKNEAKVAVGNVSGRSKVVHQQALDNSFWRSISLGPIHSLLTDINFNFYTSGPLLDYGLECRQ